MTALLLFMLSLSQTHGKGVAHYTSFTFAVSGRDGVAQRLLFTSMRRAMVDGPMYNDLGFLCTSVPDKDVARVMIELGPELERHRYLGVLENRIMRLIPANDDLQMRLAEATWAKPEKAKIKGSSSLEPPSKCTPLTPEGSPKNSRGSKTRGPNPAQSPAQRGS